MNSGLRGIVAPIGIGNLRYKPAGKGARSRIAQAALRDLCINVKEHGAFGNGRADDTRAIQAAITACGIAGGGWVFLPAGSYRITSTLTVADPNVHIIGAGQQATQILTPITNIDVVRFFNAVKYLNGSLRDLHIQCTGTATAGAGVAIENVGAVLVRNVSIKATFRGLTFFGTDTACRAFEVDIQNTVNNAVWINSTGNNQYLKNVTTFGCNGAILVTRTLGWWMEGCVTQADLGNGFAITAATGNVVQNGFISNCDIDDSDANGILIDSTGGGNIINVRMVNVRAGFANFKGLSIDGPQSDYLSFVNCNFERCLQEGVWINNCTKASLTNCSVLGNSSGGAGSNGIKVLGGDDIEIIGGYSGAYPDVGNNQGFGLEITSAFTGALTVRGLNVRGNATGGISNSSTSTLVDIQGCQGNQLPWILVPKTNFEARSNTATLANDGDLKFQMAANTNYMIRARVYFSTGATADFKYALTGPASPSSVSVVRKHIDPSALTSLVATSEGAYTASTAIAGGAGTAGGYIEFDVRVRNGANAGTFAFQWAQNTSDATAAVVLEGSYLEYRVI